MEPHVLAAGTSTTGWVVGYTIGIVIVLVVVALVALRLPSGAPRRRRKRSERRVGRGDQTIALAIERHHVDAAERLVAMAVDGVAMDVAVPRAPAGDGEARPAVGGADRDPDSRQRPFRHQLRQSGRRSICEALVLER